MEEVPFDDRRVPRAEIDWERSAWWWHPITRALHPAIKMLALVTSLLALWSAKAGILLGVWMFSPDWEAPSGAGPAVEPFRSHLLVWLGSVIQSILSFQQLGLRELAFGSFVALWLAAVFSLFGGVLARRGMVELGQRSIAPWGESARIVVSRWQSFLWSTGMHLVGMVALLVPVLLLGWLSRWGSVGATLAGVLLIACFPIVFGVGRLALSMVVCFPLSVCAIAAEKRADAFEGFSRSNAYFFQRPVVALICVLLLLLIGTLGEQLIYWTLTLGWGLVRGTYFWAGGATQPASETYVSTGNWLTLELMRAYWFSFFWAASAAIYLILRKSVDHTELDELERLTSSTEQSLPEIPTNPPEPESDATTAETSADSDSDEGAS